MNYRKLLITLAFFLGMAFNSMSIPADKTPITIKQPNGKTLTYILQGDERIHWGANPPLNAPLPSVTPPARKLTVPVGVAPGPDTVAVNVTDCANVLGFRLDANAGNPKRLPY